MKGNVPADIDFAQRRPRTPWWSWALLGAGTLACAAVAGELVSQRALHAENAAAEARLAARIERARGGVRDTRTPRADAQAQARTARVFASLHQPWFSLLDALERSAAPQVPMLQLTVDAKFERALLQVQAPDLAQLFDYVAALDAAGAPVRGAQLVSHEWVGDDAARRLRARMSLQLSKEGV